MIKGIIVDVKDSYGVILTDNGEFLKINRFGVMMEGQPVIVTEEDIIMESKQENNRIEETEKETNILPFKKNKKWNTAFLGVIAASLLVIAISSAWFVVAANTIYTAVIVDINPSIELDLNKNNKVIKMVALNEDALTLNLADLKGKDIEDALEILVEDAGSKGFFIRADGDYVLVTTVAMKDQSIESLQAKLQEKFEDSDILQRTNIALTSITPEQLKTAKLNQIPAGLVALASSGSDTTVQGFFKVEDNVKAFEDSGVVLRGQTVDSVSSPTPTESSSSSSSSDSVSEMKEDLSERLLKLKGVANPSEAILSFIKRAEAYFSTGTGDLKVLTAESKSLWDSVKENDDDDDSDDDSDDDANDDSDDDADDDSDDDADDDSDDEAKDDDDSDDDSNDDSDDSDDDSDDDSTQGTTSSTTETTNDSIAHLRADLTERLTKLKTVSSPSVEIKSFIVKADAYFASGTGDLNALTAEAKRLWDAVKDSQDDDSDDEDSTEDSTEDSSDDDSDDDSEDSTDASDDSNDD